MATEGREIKTVRDYIVARLLNSGLSPVFRSDDPIDSHDSRAYTIEPDDPERCGNLLYVRPCSQDFKKRLEPVHILTRQHIDDPIFKSEPKTLSQPAQ